MKQETIRQNLLHQLARKSLSIARDRAIIAIDGVDGSGKTTLADELAVVIAAFGRNVVRASIDGFHHPRERRYLLGRDSSSSGQLQPKSTLVIDGIFLHRDELVDSWNMSAFLEVPFSISYQRMAARDGSNPDPHAPANRRYLQGQRLYMRLCNPYERADVLVDNAELEAPRILREGDRHPDVQWIASSFSRIRWIMELSRAHRTLETPQPPKPQPANSMTIPS